MEEQNSMKINQLPSKTWYWLGLNDTKVKWAAGAPCEICAEEPSADDEITGFPEAMNTGAGKETDVLFAPEQTKNWNVSAKEGQTKQVTLSIGQGKETVSSINSVLDQYKNWAFVLAFTSIGLETNFREIKEQFQGGKPLTLYVVGQLFNIVLTFAAVYLLLSGKFFPLPNLAL